MLDRGSSILGSLSYCVEKTIKNIKNVTTGKRSEDKIYVETG